MGSEMCIRDRVYCSKNPVSWLDAALDSCISSVCFEEMLSHPTMQTATAAISKNTKMTLPPICCRISSAIFFLEFVTFFCFFILNLPVDPFPFFIIALFPLEHNINLADFAEIVPDVLLFTPNVSVITGAAPSYIIKKQCMREFR